MTSEDFFEFIEKHFNHKLPFVAYRKPNENIVKALLQSNDVLHFTSDFIESGFVLAPFDDKNDSVLIPSKDSKFIKSEYVKSRVGETSHIEASPNPEQKQNHITLVKKAIHAITNEEFKKVVLSRKETQEISEKNPLTLFKNLLNNYPLAFVYCWYHPKVGLWLGASPETLLKLQGNRLNTMALAATQKFNGTLEVNWTKKEQDEQQIVSKYIVSNLAPVVDKITVSKAQTIKAGHLLHIQTQISGHLNSQSQNLKQIIKVLHPTPAICGLPKEAAKQFILNNENYDREYYTGFLGELNFKETYSRNTNRRNVENSAYTTIKTESHLFVNLRCMQINDKLAFIYVGGGITQGSNPELEWEETENKASTMTKIL